MTAMRRCIASAFLLLFATLVLAADTAPDAIVKSTVDDVLAVIKQNKQDRQALRELAEKKVLPKFDFKRMTQLAVGPGWREANPAQKEALENGFRTLLVNTYTAALSTTATANPTVDVKPVQMKPDQDDVTVKTIVKDSGKQQVSVDYRMEKLPEGWKVYDVVVENLSLVTNYRGTFNDEVKRSGIDGLIKALDQKNRAIAKG
jgi:phospholipid transport system substrate-binding protein